MIAGCFVEVCSFIRSYLNMTLHIIIVIFRTDQLDISNMFPAFPLIVERPQWLFEGGNLALHLDENGAPLSRWSLPNYELSQELD